MKPAGRGTAVHQDAPAGSPFHPRAEAFPPPQGTQRDLQPDIPASQRGGGPGSRKGRTPLPFPRAKPAHALPQEGMRSPRRNEKEAGGRPAAVSGNRMQGAGGAPRFPACRPLPCAGACAIRTSPLPRRKRQGRTQCSRHSGRLRAKKAAARRILRAARRPRPVRRSGAARSARSAGRNYSLISSYSPLPSPMASACAIWLRQSVTG